MTELDLSPLDTDQPVEPDLEQMVSAVPLDKVQFKAMVTTLAAKRVRNQLEIEEGEYHKYTNLLQQGMEDSIRTELATEALIRKTELIMGLQLSAIEASDPKLVQDLVDVEVGYDLETDKLTIIEEAAAAEIVDSALESEDRADTEAKDLDRAEKSGGQTASERDAEITASAIMMTDRLSKLTDKLGLNWDTLSDVGAILFPGGMGAITNQNIETNIDPILPGNDLREQKIAYDVMTLAEQTIAVDKIIDHFEGDPLKALIILSYLQDLADWEVWMENAGGILDASLIVFPAVTKLLPTVALGILKTIKAINVVRNLSKGKVATAGLAVGNRIKAVETAESVAEGVKRGDITHDSDIAREAGETYMESQLRGLDAPLHAGVSGWLNDRLNEIFHAKQAFLNTNTSKLLSTSERNVLIQEMQLNLQETMIATGHRHVDVLARVSDAQRLDEDVFGLTYTVIYGDKFGQGFATAEAADRYADLLKLDGYKITTSELNGVHFLQVSKRASNEAGFITTTIKAEEATSRIGVVYRYLRSNTSIAGLTASKAAHLTVAAREGATAAAKRLEKIKYAVPKSEREYLDQVIYLGTHENGGTFYSVKTLRERFQFTDAQVAGYKAFQAEEDLFHLLDNSAEFVRRNSAGYKTITLKKAIKGLESFVAKPVKAADIKNPGNKSIWSASSGKFQKDMTPESLKALEAKGWRILQMEEATESTLLQPVQFILMKAADAVVDNLSISQIPYRPGGRREYADQTFLKMGRIRETEGGVPIILRAKTFGVGAYENVKTAAKAYEEARQAWIKGGAGVNEAIELATLGRFKNAEAFEDAIGLKNLEMSKKHNMPFEAVRDGEILSGVQEKITAGVGHLIEDVKEANTFQRMIQDAGSSRSARGDHLPAIGKDRMEDFTYGRPAAIINPRESASSSITKAIQILSLENFRIRQTKVWFDSFSSVIDIKKHPGRTPLGWLMEDDSLKYIKPRGTWGSAEHRADLKAINLAKAHEKQLKMTLGTPTMYDHLRSQFMEGLIARVAPALGKVGVSERRLDRISKADPVRFVRAVAYHTKLGMGGFNQPIVQIQAAALMMSIEPVHGFRAVLTAPVLALMLLSENSSTLKHMAKIGVRLAPGSDNKTIQEGFEVLKKTNNWRINSGSLAEQDYHHLSAPTLLTRALELGQAPFINTERFNKISSTYAAFLKWRKANPKAKIDDDVIDHIRTKGNQMVASMDRVDRAQWQDGFAGVMTQFWGYPARFLEMMVPQFVGGSKAFKPHEKWQIAMGQLVLNGVGGTVGVGQGRRLRELINAEYTSRYGEEPPEAFQALVEKGATSTLIDYALGTDQTSLYQRTGANLLESGPGLLISKAFAGEFSELPDLDAPGLRIIQDIYEDSANFLNAVKYVTNPRDAWNVLSVEFTKVFTENISSLRDAEVFRKAVQFEYFVNRHGRITDTDVTWQRGMAKLFGIDTSSAASTYAAKGILTEMKKEHAKASREYGRIIRLWAQGSITNADLNFYNLRGKSEFDGEGEWGGIVAGAFKVMTKNESAKMANDLKAKYNLGIN